MWLYLYSKTPSKPPSDETSPHGYGEKVSGSVIRSQCVIPQVHSSPGSNPLTLPLMFYVGNTIGKRYRTTFKSSMKRWVAMMDNQTQAVINSSFNSRLSTISKPLSLKLSQVNASDRHLLAKIWKKRVRLFEPKSFLLFGHALILKCEPHRIKERGTSKCARIIWNLNYFSI